MRTVMEPRISFEKHFLTHGTNVRITKDQTYEELAKASIRGCLNLFFADGMASCAMVYPDTVNGKKAHYYDPWANDQDWALYYAVKWGA